MCTCASVCMRVCLSVRVCARVSVCARVCLWVCIRERVQYLRVHAHVACVSVHICISARTRVSVLACGPAGAYVCAHAHVPCVFLCIMHGGLCTCVCCVQGPHVSCLSPSLFLQSQSLGCQAPSRSPNEGACTCKSMRSATSCATWRPQAERPKENCPRSREGGLSAQSCQGRAECAHSLGRAGPGRPGAGPAQQPPLHWCGSHWAGLEQAGPCAQK